MVGWIALISAPTGGHEVGGEMEGGKELSVGEGEGEGEISGRNRSGAPAPKVKCSNMVRSDWTTRSRRHRSLKHRTGRRGFHPQDRAKRWGMERQRVGRDGLSAEL